MGLSGILFGLAAAACQSVSYIFTRLYVTRRHRAAVSLLITSHLVMAVASLVALPFAWSADVPAVRVYGLPLACATVSYLVAQVALFILMRRVEASRVAPLLGFKIVILAFISTTFTGDALALRQVGAVSLCLCATLVLQFAGGALPRGCVGWLLVACTGYSLSDLGIVALVHSLAPLAPLHASIVGVCMCYIACGVVVLALLPAAGGRRTLAEWPYAVPFAAAWLLSMVLLFACFGMIGAVYGNILQSTRGIVSIVLGALLARCGLHDLEQKVSSSLLVRRVTAACLVCVSIWLFQSAVR